MTVQDLIAICEAEDRSPDEMHLGALIGNHVVEVDAEDGSETDARALTHGRAILVLVPMPEVV